MSRLLTPAEVAELLQVTPRTINRYAADGRLPRVKIGQRLTRYRWQNVEALIVVGNATSPAAEPDSSQNSGKPSRHDEV
jgi:excisionase family DNA binding protein